MTQNVVITGAFGALGAALAEAARAAGARVALVDFATPGAGQGGGAEVVLGGVDLSDQAAASRVMTTAAERLGGVDALFNIAGGFRMDAAGDGFNETWAAMHRINALTCLNASRAATSLLKASGRGCIVNVGANAALRPAPGMSAYAASKAAVHRLTLDMAEELKTAGVRVNAVLPSILDTPANRADMPKADFQAWVQPPRLAAVMLFLASEQAADVTGALIPVTGRV
jgi:NAD(P)-dependent dehydrogenase (short-subunit alcohol dehydrogenase family)